MHSDRLIQLKIKTNRREPAAAVKAELETSLNIVISESTVRRRLHEAGLYGRVARKKPYVNKINRGKCLEYARIRRDKHLGYGNDVIWSDESKFNLFGSDGKVMVWRTTTEELDPKCTVPTVQHGGGSVKCLGCFSSYGVQNLVFIDGNMTGEMYRAILDNNLLQLVNKLGMEAQ